MTPKKIKRISGSRHHACFAACCFMGVAFAALAQSDSMDTFGGDPDKYSFLWIPSDSGDWTRHFHIGGVVGFNISANFSEHGTFNVPGPANGIYSDGYVRPDSSGNAFGQTSNWGYNNASQYDYATQTLLMHGTTSYTTSGSSKSDGGPFPGFDMVYGDNLWYWKHARVGWELGFGLMPIDIQNNSSMAAAVNGSTYSFDTSNPENSPIPGAPYSGSFNRQPYEWTVLVPGSLGTTTTPQPSAEGVVSGNHELDLMLYTLRFGPSFYWDLNDYLGLALGAGPAAGIVSGDYKYSETITANGLSTRNTGEFGATDFTFGGYVNGALMYHVINDADFYLSAQYMPLGSVNFSNGVREGKLDLGGQIYLSLGISWPF
jgi:hypothetical protein